MSIYGFWQGPSYRPSTREEQWQTALDLPMSMGATAVDQSTGEFIGTYGIGTIIQEMQLPPAAPGRWYGDTDESYADRRKDYDTLTEEEYKASPYFRENLPWDNGMTKDRAAALAMNYDAKRVREHFASKRPITSFIAGIAGQALDPINYIPVLGPSVRAAAVARMGVVKGIAATAALDAAANTAIAGLATRETRRGFGDDVSWQAMVSEIATAALLGTAFGTVGGLLERRAGNRADALRSEAEVKVNTLRATQEARIALNEAIGGLANDGEVRLSPNGVAPIERMQREITAYHGSPHTFDRFDINKIGTGEGAAAYGRGLYFAESEDVARNYQTKLSDQGQGGQGALYKVKIKGTDEDFLDYDAAVPVDHPLRNELSELGKMGAKSDDPALRNMGKDAFLAATNENMTGQGLYNQLIRAADANRDLLKERFGEAALFTDPAVLANKMLNERGIIGIRYLDQNSRMAGEGTRNFVVFDDNLVSVETRNGQPIDASPARPEPPPAGRAEAEAKVAKPENYKALADQYRVDPEAGTFPEEAELRQLAQAGRLSDEDMAVLDDADGAFQDGVSYGEALKSVVNCLL